MGNTDIRWEQRFTNFNKAFAKLKETVDTLDPEADNFSDALSDLEKEGLIQRFEYTHELAWKVMKDYIEYQGSTDIGGSRDATREAFKMGLIDNGETWMDMIKSRNLTTHTYNEATAEDIFTKIVNDYFKLFTAFQSKMEHYRSREQQDIFSIEL
ncbi:nucleotidyltransferase substrate binding protein [Flavobacterium subsaxonicum]|uniref:Nucleotidyltransferase n=1 Tax=Flavobacterium subsaxonicum WB 4.1-42 = DSM 21790 TaxID=1121898 RepID=A0A0A2MIF0_9FLAO|nr:nucleotidyltransferase substrate binding protein [Flavobacterium subsaxonicum]KGO92074.1 nucleotidyltransferase [Flavobacterium subsaxonicum WB 4.1-42 = DSM 21790]